MIAIRKTKRGSERPVVGGEIDWSHPLASALADAFLLNENAGPPRSLVYGDTATTVLGGSYPNWRPSNGGPDIARCYDGNGGLDRFADRPGRSITGPVSICAGVYSTYTFSVWGEIVSRRPSTAASNIEYGFNWNLNSGNPIINFYWCNNSAYQTANITTSDHPQNKLWHVAGTRSSGNVAKVYSNGALGVTSAALSAATAGTNPLVLGAINDGTESMVGSLYYVYIWARELAANEVAWIAREPYTLIRTPAYRRVMVPPGAGGGGSHAYTSAFVIN